GACGCAMTSSQTSKGTRRYRYYVCRHAQKRGWQTCPAPSLPAGVIEDLVVQQIQRLAPAGASEEFVARWQALPLGEQARVLQWILDSAGKQLPPEGLAVLLEMTGNETQTAHDGLEAVEVAAALGPDVV